MGILSRICLYHRIAIDTDVTFTYRKTEYAIRITGVSIFPQGYAAVAPYITKLHGMHILVDIGNGTMNVITVPIDLRPRVSYLSKQGKNIYFCRADGAASFQGLLLGCRFSASLRDVHRTSAPLIPRSAIRQEPSQKKE